MLRTARLFVLRVSDLRALAERRGAFGRGKHRRLEVGGEVLRLQPVVSRPEEARLGDSTRHPPLGAHTPTVEMERTAAEREAEADGGPDDESGQGGCGQVQIW